MSALSTDAVSRHLLTSANYSSYALPLTGGTMTGDAAISWGINDRTDWDTYASGIRVMSSVTADSGAPVQYATGISVMARYSFQIAAKGGNADNFFMRAGTRDWKEIYHAGNCNLPTIPWTCWNLTATNSVTARRGVYGYIEFSNIDSSANNGGYLDFHFNGSTADYTSRIVEDAAGQLTLRANTIVVPGVVHATIGIYTDGYISARKQDTASDIKLKKDFRSIDNALKYVLNTHYTRFRWKDDDKESIGIIAQEEQSREYGFLVQNRKEIGHLTYDYAASTALLGAAIQEEDSKVEKLRERIMKLENELSNLKKRKWQH